MNRSNYCRHTYKGTGRQTRDYGKYRLKTNWNTMVKSKKNVKVETSSQKTDKNILQHT